MFMQKLFRFIGIGILGVIMCLLYSPFLFAGRGERNMSARIITSSVVTGEELDLLSRTGWIGENRNLIDFDSSYKTLNLRDSLNMEFVGRGLYGPPISVFVRDTLTFVGTNAALMIFNISNPLELFLLGHIPIHLGSGWDIFVVDDYAYVAQWGGPDGGIQIIDISDPTAPQEISYYETNDIVLSIYVSSTYVYACVGSGLLILNVSDPFNPYDESFLDFGGMFIWTQEVDVVGNYAYVAVMNSGLKVVDVSVPAAPIVVGTFLSDGLNRGVRVRGDYAYLSFDHGMGIVDLIIVDISDPTQPNYMGECGSSGFNPYIAGNYAYVNKMMLMIVPGELQIIDISDPNYPVEVGSCDVEGSPWEVDGDTSFAYVATGCGGLQVVDVSDVSTPVPVADYYTGHVAYSVEVVDSYAYIADLNFSLIESDKGRLWVLDVSDPTDPIVISSLETGDNCRQVSIQLPYAYVVDATGGMKIVDVADPANPWEVGCYNTPGLYARGIDVTGDYAYVVGYIYGVGGLYILNISDPASPFIQGTCTVTSPRKVFVDGNLAYITAATSSPNGGMYIIDVSNPAAPSELGHYTTHGSPELPTHEIYVLGDLAYIADGTGGLRIVEVSDPANPVERSSFAPRGPAISVYIEGDFAYVGTGFQMGGIPGVEVIDISDTYNPTSVGYYDLYYLGADVCVESDLVYVANGPCGFYILRYTGGSGIDDEYSEVSLNILSQNYPNPFHSTATISYQLKEHGEVILSIYNVRGQLVKKLVHSREIVGKHSIVWDGKDEGGKKLSSGIYFYQIETPNFKSQIKKMVLIR